MKEIALLLLLLFISRFPNLSPIFAQKQDAVDPSIYSAVQRKLKVDELLQGRDPATLSEEELDKVYTASLDAGTIPDIGAMKNQTGKSYVFETGLSGFSQGSIPKGLYKISIKSIDDIVFILPTFTFLPRSSLQNDLAIGMREEKGKGKIIDLSDTLSRKIDVLSLQKNSRIVVQRVSSLFVSINKSIIKIVTKFTQKGKNAPILYPNPLLQTIDQTIPVTIKLFTDANRNGKVDPNEATVLWAGVQITLTKISQEKELSLQSGDNVVRFERVPANTRTAYELLSEVLSSGVSEATISGTVKRENLVVSVKDTKFKGDNFSLRPKAMYTVAVPKSLELLLFEKDSD